MTKYVYLITSMYINTSVTKNNEKLGQYSTF